ncbi:MAG: hypothetical protein ACI8XM_001955 [Haloarculaceae archaeon]|jgi:hypothetical protein
MRPPQHSRRQWLGTLTALGATGMVAGCSSVPGLGSDQSGPNRVDLISAGSTAAIHLDVAGMLSDSTLREAANEALGDLGMQMVTVESAMEQAQREIGLDPRGLNEVLAFGPAPEAEQFTVLAWTEWTAEEVLSTNGDLSQMLSEDTYSGTTVYREGTSPEASMFAVLEEGVFAFGQAQNVETSVDVWNGDTDPVSGNLRDAYTAATGGYLRYGFEVPGELIPEQSDGQFDLSVFEEVSYGYGSLAAGANEFTLSFEMESDSAAGDLNDLVSGVLSLAETELAQSMPGTDGQREKFGQVIEDTTVQTDGQTVTVQNSSGASTMAVGLITFPTFLLGVGGQRSSSTAQTRMSPQAAFGFEYDVEEGSLTITHQAGDVVEARELFVRGTGVSTSSWVELGGSASGTVDGAPAVVAGDSVTLTDVDPAVELQVVWQSAKANSSSTLAEFDGPQA